MLDHFDPFSHDSLPFRLWPRLLTSLPCLQLVGTFRSTHRFHRKSESDRGARGEGKSFARACDDVCHLPADFSLIRAELRLGIGMTDQRRFEGGVFDVPGIAKVFGCQFPNISLFGRLP